MQIEFVNHASFIMSYDGIRMICDPWMEGTAFHGGWALIEPTAFRYEEFDQITHIWFSHEHPDHFSPPNLKKIPPEIRKNITILFQKTKDRKVVKFCQDLGFGEVIEIDTTWFRLSPKIELLNIPHTDGDSWLCIRTDQHVLLNVNDCGLESNAELKAIKNRIGEREIDVLFTQFSYANWSGNREERETRKSHADNKLREICRQTSILKPRYTVPFASYMWFCHSENFYMNDEANTPEQVFEKLQNDQNTEPVILFPGDTWRVGTQHNSLKANSKWMESYRLNIREENCIPTKSSDEGQLFITGQSFLKKLHSENNMLISFILKPTYIYLEDYGCTYTLSRNHFAKAENPTIKADVHITADALNYCFKFPWGGATTRINGRYQIPSDGNFGNWKRYFQISELNNHGRQFGPSWILETAVAKIKNKLGGVV